MSPYPLFIFISFSRICCPSLITTYISCVDPCHDRELTTDTLPSRLEHLTKGAKCKAPSLTLSPV